MKAKKYSEEQIIGALQEADAGAKVEDVCRRLGVSKVTVYRWKAKFSGMQVSDAKRLRQLEDENTGSSRWSRTRRWTSRR
jgi:putative transposase